MNKQATTQNEPTVVRSILAATDFSEVAEAGVAAAARLAKRHGAVLHAYHAVDLSYFASTTIVPSTEMLDGLHAHALENLEQATAGHREAGVELDLQVRDGRAADVLLEAADEVDADLVVLATHGRSGLAHMLLGSTAEHVLQRTRRPVLSLHRQDSLPALPPRKILIPTDLSGDATLAVEGARRLLAAEPGDTEIILLHSVEVPSDTSRNVAAKSWSRMLVKLKAQGQERLEAIATEIRALGFTVTPIARLGAAAELILDEALTLEPEAIVMRTAERTALGRIFLGSTARRVVQRAACPVLTIRWSAPADHPSG